MSTYHKRWRREEDQWKFMLGPKTASKALAITTKLGFIRVHNRSPKVNARIKHSLTQAMLRRMT